MKWNEIENRKTIENQTHQNWFFEKIKNIDKT